MTLPTISAVGIARRVGGRRRAEKRLIPTVILYGRWYEIYVSGGRDTYLRERLIQDAVIRNFEVIGEAASRLSPETRAVAGVPWAKVIAFRNRLIHGYWSIDHLLVWDVIVNDLPSLKQEVGRLLAKSVP